MNRKIGWSILVVTVLLLVIGFYLVPNVLDAQPPQNQPREHKLLIKKIKNKWKVVDESDTTRTKIYVKRGEKITWTAEGTDAYFQFMGLKLFGNYTKSLKAGQKLTLVIGNKARLGIHQYAVFCLPDKEFAEGDSPPELDLGP